MKFSWDCFDLTFLKEVIRYTDAVEDKELFLRTEDKDAVISCMNTICMIPDERFIREYRPIIEQYVLVYYQNEVKKICKSLNISAKSYNEKQAMMTKKPLSANLINAYKTALMSIGGMEMQEYDYSNYKYTRALNMSETKIEDVPLFDFQQAAVKALKQFFIGDDNKKGLLVMPTGSGKSRTATYFLIKEMVSRGYQIIWLAHRHMLLDQAADCFFRFAGLSKIENPKIRNYRISCISGEHLRISQVDKHEIVVASIASVCRNKEHLRRILGRKVMIVVDEAHHTFAPTYRETIRFIEKCRKNVKVLGLTATPVRANDKDSNALMKLYENNIVYSISMSELIARGILATPRFIRKETGENFEPMISIDEERLIRRYGELPESLINKIAKSNSRNKVILNEYLKNKEAYGKTLIFAMNILHCRLLYDELNKKKVKCGYIYSGKEDNTKVINDFKNGMLDVLINVNIMTEGTDVPDIRTVFLTRPTQSEGLLMQMIGRGMRGPQAAGTEEVNIVDFHDKWDVFNRWLNPEWLLSEEPSGTPITKIEKRKVSYIRYEWDLCREIYRSMVFKNQELGRYVMLPAGWYTLIDDEGELVRMLVFESQLAGFRQMKADKKQWINDEGFKAETAVRRYFGGLGEKPALHELELFIDNVRNNEYPPTIRPLECRKQIEPVYVVQKAEEERLDIFALAEDLYEKYSVTKDLYDSKEDYIRKVCDAKINKGKSEIIGRKVEELPKELIPFDLGKPYDLDLLVQEVKDEMFDGSYDGLGNIRWTDKPYRQFYGRFFTESHDIEINMVLNSESVPKDVVKYIIYHEMLHRDYPHHDKAFKEEEHKYPKFEEWDHFLDDNMYRFDIQDW